MFTDIIFCPTCDFTQFWKQSGITKTVQLILNKTLIRCFKGEEERGGKKGLGNMLGRIVIFTVLLIFEVWQLNDRLFIFFTYILKKVSVRTQKRQQNYPFYFLSASEYSEFQKKIYFFFFPLSFVVITVKHLWSRLQAVVILEFHLIPRCFILYSRCYINKFLLWGIWLTSPPLKNKTFHLLSFFSWFIMLYLE